jgi:hypothetical protein
MDGPDTSDNVTYRGRATPLVAKAIRENAVLHVCQPITVHPKSSFRDAITVARAEIERKGVELCSAARDSPLEKKLISRKKTKFLADSSQWVLTHERG